MLNFFKKLFGTNKPSEAPLGSPAFNPEYVEALEQPKKGLEFHEEIRAQVEAEASFPVKEIKPVVKAKTTRSKKTPAKIKAESKPAPVKKKATPKKSK